MADSDRVRQVQAGGKGGPLAVAALIVISVVLAVLKPWGGASPGLAPASSAAHPRTGAVPEPSADPTVDPAAGVGGPCYYGRAWRLFTTDTSSNGPVGTWYDLQPVPAAGPDDATIPVVQVHSDTLDQLGYCRMTDPGRPVHVLATRAWQLIEGSDPRSIRLAAADQAEGVDPDVGALYLPPTVGHGAAGAVWAPAVYVFEIQLETSPLSAEWFAVRVG